MARYHVNHTASGTTGTAFKAGMGCTLGVLFALFVVCAGGIAVFMAATEESRTRAAEELREQQRPVKVKSPPTRKTP